MWWKRECLNFKKSLKVLDVSNNCDDCEKTVKKFDMSQFDQFNGVNIIKKRDECGRPCDV